MKIKYICKTRCSFKDILTDLKFMEPAIKVSVIGTVLINGQCGVIGLMSNYFLRLQKYCKKYLVKDFFFHDRLKKRQSNAIKLPCILYDIV